jgi:hypothetical protein
VLKQISDTATEPWEINVVKVETYRRRTGRLAEGPITLARARPRTASALPTSVMCRRLAAQTPTNSWAPCDSCPESSTKRLVRKLFGSAPNSRIEESADTVPETIWIGEAPATPGSAWQRSPRLRSSAPPSAP